MSFSVCMRTLTHTGTQTGSLRSPLSCTQLSNPKISPDNDAHFDRALFKCIWGMFARCIAACRWRQGAEHPIHTHTHTHFPSALSWLYDGWDRERGVLHQHKCTGRGSARAALRGSVSLRALYCRSFYTLLREARVISYADSHHCSFYHADTFMHMHSYLEIHFSSSSSSNTKLIPFLGKRAIVNSSAATPTVSKSPFYWRLFIFKQFSTHVRGGGGVVGRNVSRATMKKECVVSSHSLPLPPFASYKESQFQRVHGISLLLLLPSLSDLVLLSIRKLQEWCHQH